MKYGVLLVASAMIFAHTIAGAQSLTSVSAFAKNLEDYRTVCAEMASKYSSEDSIARYKDGLDSETRNTQAQIDAKVYSVGHGGHQATEYLISRMQQLSEQDAQQSKRRDEEGKAHRDEVNSCVARALDSGKLAYASFKKGKHPKPIVDEATSVMTAWVVNTQTISLATPSGTPDSKTEWDKAKAHADLGSL